MDAIPEEITWHKEVILHVASEHLGGSTEFKELNPGIGLRVREGDRQMFMTVGVFQNSIDRTSVYAAAVYDFARSQRLTAAIGVGALTGYLIPVTLMVPLEVRVKVFEKWSVAVQFLPKANSQTDNVVGMSVVKRF